MPPGGAFTALLVLICGLCAAIVPPPTDLTVSCDNANVTARWNYPGQHADTRFRLTISGAAGDYTNETSDHHYDLTSFIWESEERYMEVYAVSVTAILGENQSQTAESDTFTFNDLRPAHVKCRLAFPPVDLKVDDQEVSVTFTNPFHSYPELNRAKRPDTAMFKFEVTTADGTPVSGKCPVYQKTCQLDVSLPEDKDPCVTLKGALYDSMGTRCMLFNETGSICPPADFHVILLILLLLGIFIVAFMVAACICLTKAWTFKEEPGLPKSLIPPSDQTMPFFTQEEEEDYSAVELIENTLMKNLSMSSEDGGLPASGDESEAEGLQGPAGPYADGNCLENSEQQLERGGSGGEDSGNDSVKTEIILIDVEEEEEKERSPYDSPHNLDLLKCQKR